MPRQMQQPMVGMPRVPAGANMAAFNAASQAGMAGLNPGNIPMQRGQGGQSHPHQVPFLLQLLENTCFLLDKYLKILVEESLRLLKYKYIFLYVGNS